ncbi:MAG: hypothetical protein AAF739_17855 [Pseudomonadota bacterium]
MILGGGKVGDGVRVERIIGPEDESVGINAAGEDVGLSRAADDILAGAAVDLVLASAA